jgi:phosphoglycerol transferase
MKIKNSFRTLRIFLSSRENLLALATLPALGAWIYSRVLMVNPAILGDEYLYSMNARKVGPWDPPVAGDFSNYLFNFVYQTTNLCGNEFYSCVKVMNIGFYLAFVFVVYFVARKFLTFLAAYGFMIVTALSPLSVYTSMFLPESMFFLFIGLVLVAVLRAMNDFNWRNWAFAGVAIGLASLVKPHAWLSSIAVGTTLIVIGMTNSKYGLKRTISAALGLAAGAALARVVIGFAVAGPKALGFFGQYFGVSVIQTVVSGADGNSAATANGIVGAGPMAGVVGLFATQFVVHTSVIFALLGVAIIGLAVSLINLIRTKNLRDAEAFSLFTFIWLASMAIEIVIFTGWVTGSGDDHTTRVLLRYYEFLFVIVPLAGLAALTAASTEKVNVWIRWTIGGVCFGLITPAFTGSFNNLTIQIADAPTLAGLVVNAQIFNAVAVISAIGILTFVTFPRFTPWVFVLLLPVTMIGAGWQTQNQYQLFRGSKSAADLAGEYLAKSYSQEELSELRVIASSRFDATNVGIVGDIPNLNYELFDEGNVAGIGGEDVDSGLIVVVGEIEIGLSPTYEGEGFRVFEVK